MAEKTQQKTVNQRRCNHVWGELSPEDRFGPVSASCKKCGAYIQIAEWYRINENSEWRWANGDGSENP